MNTPRVFAVLGLAAMLLSGCEAIISSGGGFIEGDAKSPDKTVDRGRDGKPLEQLVAGIWVDPNGCEHWMIDDGVEGYLSQRVDPYGKPVCGGHGRETFVTGPFKEGTDIPDLAN